MDHLLRPEGTENFITVTYGVEESGFYDGQGFFDYPQRKGWTEDDLMGLNNFGNRSDKEVINFFQTWLFFGMGIEVLGAAGIKAETKDFVRPGETGYIVNTEALPAMLVQWKKLWPLPEGISKDCTCKSWIDPNQNKCREKVCWKNFPHARDSPAWFITSAILDRVCFFMDRYCTSTSRQREGLDNPEHVWPVTEEVIASILALGGTLRNSAISIFDIPRMGNEWGKASSTLVRGILSEKWCKADAALIMEDLQFDGQYYIAAGSSPDEAYLKFHSPCVEGQCRSKVDETQYYTRHAPGCTSEATGECLVSICYGKPESGKGDREADWPEPVQFEKDVVNVITCHGAVTEGREVDLTMIGTPIIIWDEEKQEVQVAEYNESRGLTPPYIAMSHVWLDGMGNPYINSIPKCQLSRIQKMIDELPLADRPEGQKVGFWLDTLCVPVRERYRPEKKWTIQHMRHIYEKSAAVLVLDSWIYQMKSTASVPERWLAVYLSNWQRRLWTFQEGCLAKDLYYRFSDKAERSRDLTDQRMKYEKEVEAQGYYSHFYGLVDSKVTIHFTLIKQVVEMFVLGTDSRDDNMWMLYLPMADALGHRQTTRLSDETLCLSTVLGMDPGPYLDIRKKGDESDIKVAERRMEKFLRTMKTFNTGLIFSDYPRITRKGFRWAPLSLLGARLANLGSIEDQLKGRLKKIGPHRGLVVKYPGTRCTPGDLLSAKDVSTGSFILAEKNGKSNVHYSVTLRSEYIKWDLNTIYGLVMSNKPKVGAEALAMIGSEPAVDEEDEDDGDDEESTHFLRYECNAVIKGIAGPAPGNAALLQFYGKNTEWMIM
ncbi:hypothetical protein ABW19_dt0206135 [Dactylella cylindrospora]|nr:hypothetical protein ABW19_dt0206135 [Dactylella cylindrospora]